MVVLCARRSDTVRMVVLRALHALHGLLPFEFRPSSSTVLMVVLRALHELLPFQSYLGCGTDCSPTLVLVLIVGLHWFWY